MACPDVRRGQRVPRRMVMVDRPRSHRVGAANRLRAANVLGLLQPTPGSAPMAHGRARGRPPETVRAAALWARSMLPSMSLEQAEADADAALTMYARAGDRAGMGLCFAAASSVAAYRGDDTTATTTVARAVDLAESAGDVAAMTWAYWFRVDNAKFDDARSHLPAALDLARQT